ncbi:hypothetical protein [Roseomonas sp. WA12]
MPSRIVLAARLGIGIAQGLGLLALSLLVDGDSPHPWVAANPTGFGLLVLLATLLPLPVLLGLGHIRMRVLAAWTLAAAGLILLLGGHDLWQHGEATMNPASNGLLASLCAMLFIGQALVAAADTGRRWWPRYADCFEAAWRAALQLALAACFVLGFWLLYWVGSELFQAIGIDALDRLAGRLGFVLPVTTVLAAAALHLADAGWRLTLGLRNLLLALKAWLTPVLAGLAAAFLLALPFTGLEILWRRDEAFGWLIVAAAALVTLVSAVHGDGRGLPPIVLRLSARLASFLVPVLLALAGWALARQVGEQGLKDGRVVGVAALAGLAIHAIAYPVAAMRPGMRLLEPANIVAALLAFPILAALNLPLADPARLEVRSQTARLLGGAVAPDDFDFSHLRHLGRDGRSALADLAGHADPEIARRARQASQPAEGTAREYTGEELALSGLRALPDGAALPPGLVEAMPQCRRSETCLARAVPPLGEDVWLVGPIDGRFWAMRPQGAGWRHLAIYDAPYGCGYGDRARLLEKEVRAVPQPLPDLDLAGSLFRPVILSENCR